MAFLAAAIGFLALASHPAASDERPLYMASVLYSGELETRMPSLLDAAADSAAPAAAAVLDRTLATGDSLARSGSRVENPGAANAPVHRQPSIALPLACGAIGGVALAYGGAVVGLATVSNDNNDEWDELGTALTGFFVGEVVGVALGTHLGNGGQGSFGADLLVSLLGGIAGVGVGAIGGTVGVVGGAALQLGLTTLVERSSARRHSAERAATGAP